MNHIETSEELKEHIIDLEERLILQKQCLVSSIHTAYQGLNPITLIKTTIQQAVGSREEKNNSLNTIIGLGAGVILKKVMPAQAGGFVKNIVAALLQLILTHKVSKSPDAIKTLNHEILNGVHDSEEQ